MTAFTPAKMVSWWQPWNIPLSVEEQVDHAVQLGAGIAMKGTNNHYIYGPESWNMFEDSRYAGKSNDHLERAAKARGVPVDIWCWVNFSQPYAHADALHAAIARWNPRRVFLDVEGAIAKANAANAGPFLRSLGRVEPKVYLQSYRVPNLHPEIPWDKLLTYTDGGQFIIDGTAPQAYYVGTQNVVADYTRMLTQWQALADAHGRPDLPWLPTLPTYTEWGWTPTPESLQAGIDLLWSELTEFDGEGNPLSTRLRGWNFFRFGFLLQSEFAGHRQVIEDVDFSIPGPPPPPAEPRPINPEWVGAVDIILRETHPSLPQPFLDQP